MQSQLLLQRTGIWVPCEGSNRFLDSRRGIELLLELLVERDITDVFLQVFRAGRAWFSSQVFESGCSDSQLLDLLGLLELNNIRAHAWVNVCNAGLNPSAGYVKLLGGEDALLRDGKGRDTSESVPDFEIDTAGIWLEPSNPKLHSAIALLVNELNQFSFAGVHLDFIRYPYALPMKPVSWIDCGVDYGYSSTALQRFKSEFGSEAFRVSGINGLIPENESSAAAFDGWRRRQINDLIVSFRRALATGRILSVAALAWSDRAYLNAYQDWRSWLKSSLVDELCLMTYTADTNLLEQQIEQAKAFLNPTQQLFAGIGLYKLDSCNQLSKQLRLISSLNTNPCYFCADRFLLPPFCHLQSSEQKV